MKQSAITTAPIQYFPLDALYLSDMNPRQDADPESIDLLADSIVAVGLLQNLAGLADEAGKVGIVAGGRRLRALTRAAEKHPDLLDRRPELAEIPVRLAPDEATARAWASVENAAREDLHPADEIRAYGRMAENGSDVPAIARVFAVTEAHVYRRLALASLPTPILDALKAGEITLEAAKCFTVAQDEALALDILDRVRGQDVSAHRLKQLLQPEAIRDTDRRAVYVGLAAYEGAGGTITRDLFGGEVFLGDAAFLPGELGHTHVHTALGDAPIGDGVPANPARVDVLVRPDDLSLTPSANGNSRIEWSRYEGETRLYGVRLDTGGELRVRTNHEHHLADGAAVDTRICAGHPLALFAPEPAARPAGEPVA